MTVYKSQSGKREILKVYSNLMERWSEEHEILEIKTSTGSTAVIKCGIAGNDPLIFIHGTGSNSASWMNDVEKYSRDYLVYLIDIPGEPGFSTEERFSLNEPDVFNKWLFEVFTALSIKSAHIVGQSLGGWIGLNFCGVYGDSVKSLTLISPGGICSPKGSYLIKMMFYLLLGNYGQKKILKMISNGEKLPEEVEEFILLTFKHFRFRTDLPEIIGDEYLKSVKVPVYYIAGENDPLLDSNKTAERLNSFLSDIKIEIEEGGHIVINQSEKILSFIKSTE